MLMSNAIRAGQARAAPVLAGTSKELVGSDAPKPRLSSGAIRCEGDDTMRARGLVSALLVAAFALMPLSASAQIARQADPGTFTTVELVDSGHRFFGTVSRGLALDHPGGGQALGRAQRLHPRPGGVGRVHRRPALRRGQALHPQRRRAADVLAGALGRLRLRRRGRPHDDARLQHAGHRGPLQALPRRSTARPISSAASG